VFEILLDWLETQNWKESFMKVIPQRKFHAESKKTRRETAKSKQWADRESEMNTTGVFSSDTLIVEAIDDTANDNLLNDEIIESDLDDSLGGQEKEVPYSILSI